jgi:transcriptional regulatory protein GAL4
VRDLEHLIHELLPDVDLDKLLAKQVSKSTFYRTQNPSPIIGSSPVGEDQEQASPESFTDYVPKVPDDDVPDDAIYGFDWNEEDGDIDLNDGMAALSVNPSNKGYFGAASSAVMLRAFKKPNDIDIQSSQEESQRSNSSRESRSNSRIDLDSTLSLTAKFLTNEFIESYFENYHTAYPFIHKETFMAQYTDQIPTPPYEIWQILLNTVLALGAWCLHGESSNFDLYYYQNAKSYLSSYVFESGSIPLLQALTLLSNYAQKRNKPNTGWNYLGLAVRMAMGLGLYKEFSNWTSSKNQLQLEMRRRLWWGLYIFDGGAAITFGRPVNLPMEQMTDINQVSNINDADYLNTTDLKKELVSVPYPTIYSGLIWQSKFTIISTEIYNRLISKPSPTANECIMLNKRIVEFIQSLPAYFSEDNVIAEKATRIPNVSKTPEWLAFARFRLIWRYKNLQLIIFRTFIWQRVIGVKNPEVLELAKSPEGKQSRRICLDSAHETILSISNFIHNHDVTVIASWYSTFFLFHASLIPVVCLCSEPNSNHSNVWKNDIVLSKRLLTRLSEVNSLANKFIAVIDNLCGKYLDEVSLNNIRAQAQDDLSANADPAPFTAEPVEDILPDFDFKDISGNGPMTDLLNLLPNDISNIQRSANTNPSLTPFNQLSQQEGSNPVKSEHDSFADFQFQAFDQIPPDSLFSNSPNNTGPTGQYPVRTEDNEIARRLTKERGLQKDLKQEPDQQPETPNKDIESDFYSLLFNDEQNMGGVDWTRQ